MKFEYDPTRDLLYIYFAEPTAKAAKTVTIEPGVHADFDSSGKLIGLEILDASEIMQNKIEFTLPEIPPRHTEGATSVPAPSGG